MSNDQRFSRFQVLGQLGRGGTAEVVRVFDTVLNREAALKIPLPDGQVDFGLLAERERALIDGYRFPGLVQLLDDGAGKSEYLLLELCSGPTLDTLGRVDDSALACNLLSALALDLEFLHACGLIHGDLKPQNFFLPKLFPPAATERSFFVKLSDFSLGRKESEPETSRAGLGTVGYMAPETIQQGRVSHRSDLFALGVIAYQLLTGKHPFLLDDPEPVRVNGRTVEEEPPAPSSLRSDISDDLSNLVMGLLAKDESARPVSAWDTCRYLRDCGATYPYEKLLRPKHIMRRHMAFANVVSEVVKADAGTTARLALLTDEKPANLQILLDANFDNCALKYDNGRFEFSGRPQWPSRMRRKSLMEFAATSLSARKAAVKGAVIESSWPPERKISRGFHRAISLPASVGDLLAVLIRPATARRVAKGQALNFERDEQFDIATHLYVMAGDLEGAERCAYQAACRLRNEHSLELALSICQSVIRFADTRQESFVVRALLMLKGDILKEMGDAPRAKMVYEQLVTLYDGQRPDSLLGEAYKDLGDLYKMKQDFDAGIKSLTHALEIFEQLGDRLEVSHVLNNMGNMYWVASDMSRAQSHYRQALTIQKRLKAQQDIASTLSNLGGTFVTTGHFKRSLRLLRLSLQLKEEIGNQVEIARTLNNLGYVSLLAGQMSQSVDYLRESLEKNRRTGNKHEVLINVSNLVAASSAAGRLKQSLRYIDEGLALAQELQSEPHVADFKMSLGIIYRRQGDCDRASRLFADADSLYRALDDRRALAEFTIHTGYLRYQVGDYDGADKIGQTALQIARDIGEKHVQLSALLLLTKLPANAHLWSEAHELTGVLHLERETRCLQFNQLERVIASGEPIRADCISVELVEMCLGADDNIDLPWMCCLAAEVSIATGNLSQAANLVKQAIRQANAMELLPESAIALALKAQLEMKAGAYENAYALYRQALQITKQMAECMGDDTDRLFFMQKRSVQFLMSEIRRLGSLLGQKQRAGSNPALVQS